jgi:DNA replication protein DnaC
MSTNTLAINIAKRLERLVVPNEEADARRKRAERGEASTRALELWGRADVPKRHAERALHPGVVDPDHPWTKTRTRILSMLGKGVTLCLTGTRGNGKTQLGVDAILTTTLDGRPAQFVSAQRLFMTFKSSFDEGARRTEIQILDSFRRASLLVIDEVGQRTESGWENRTLFELLNARYGDMTDTILTCNLDRPMLAENLGPSIISRMQEGGGILECNWPSFRG